MWEIEGTARRSIAAAERGLKRSDQEIKEVAKARSLRASGSS